MARRHSGARPAAPAVHRALYETDPPRRTFRPTFVGLAKSPALAYFRCNGLSAELTVQDRAPRFQMSHSPRQNPLPWAGYLRHGHLVGFASRQVLPAPPLEGRPARFHSE